MSALAEVVVLETYVGSTYVGCSVYASERAAVQAACLIIGDHVASAEANDDDRAVVSRHLRALLRPAAATDRDLRLLFDAWATHVEAAPSDRELPTPAVSRRVVSERA